MKIKYLTCDGETVAEEEITKAEFYKYKNYLSGEETQEVPEIECIRPDGSSFVIYFENVREIKA